MHIYRDTQTYIHYYIYKRTRTLMNSRCIKIILILEHFYFQIFFMYLAKEILRFHFIIIIIIAINPWWFLTLTLADGLSLESEWQQISSGL